MRALTSILCVTTLCLAATALRCQSQGNVADTAAIRAVVQGEQDAWNNGDAQAFGAHYAEDGSFTNVVGQQLYGKPAFIKQHDTIFRTIYKGSHNVLSVGKISFVRPDVVIVDIDGVLSGATRLPPGLQAMEDGALHVKLQEVMSRTPAGWTINAFHNVAVSPLVSAPPAAVPPSHSE